ALPKRDRTARAWKKVGVTVVRRPVRVLAMSLVLLLGLAVCATFIDVSYDDRSGLPDDLQSNEGYAMLDAHFPKDFVLPQYLVIASESNMRTPEGLADLEQMAARVAQLQGVTAVRGITRPDGKPLTESSVSYQAGRVGSGLADAASEIDSRAAEFTPMLDKVDQMVAAITDLREMSEPMFAAAVDASDLLDRAGGFDGLDARLAEVQGASGQLEAMNGAIDEFANAAMQLAELAPSAEPLIKVLNTSSFCDVDPRCVQLRSQLQLFVGVGNDSLGARVTRLRDAVTTLTGGSSISETLGEARDALASVKSAIVALGGDPNDPGGLVSTAQGTIGTMAVDAQAFGGRFAELGPAKDQLQSGLQQAADYLLELKNNASSQNMAGFYIPAIVVNSIDFQTAASVFVGADGHVARYLISTEFGAFGDEAIELTGKIRQTAQAAVPNTSLENSTVEVAGATSLTEDVKKYLNDDFLHIMITTLIIVALVLILLLRAVLAPLYLLISVVLSYVSALGLGVIVFQLLLGQELSWMLAPMAFIVLVAVGADYNMLLISRLRDESSRGIRVGVIRTVASTGSVITSAGIIFAASMFGLMAGQFQGMIQIGFVIGTGLLLDTFIVRTVTVPALASLIGRGNWWPSKV
ncbi:MAG: MMPL family transporter, partial [Candidatus Nanopelagicales bacterium]